MLGRLDYQGYVVLRDYTRHYDMHTCLPDAFVFLPVFGSKFVSGPLGTTGFAYQRRGSVMITKSRQSPLDKTTLPREMVYMEETD